MEDTGVERELSTHCQDPLEGSLCHNSADPLVIVKAEAIRSRSNFIEIKRLQLAYHGEQVRQPKHCRFHRCNGLQRKP
jgi:hypothetical protein